MAKMKPYRALFECPRLESRQLLCGAHDSLHISTQPSAPADISRRASPAALQSGDARSIDQINVPAYSSRPGASKKLYLDFNGMPKIDGWGGWWAFGGETAGPTSAYDLDGNGLNYSYAERVNIEKV